MSSSGQTARTQQTDNIVISNIGQEQTRYLDANQGQSELNRALELSGVLQSTLDLETLFQLFAREAAKTVSFNGLVYSNRDINKKFETGRKARHQSHYRLVVGTQKLGELTIFRARKFSENETVALEYLLTSLLYPLRNSILYFHALQTALHDPLTGANNRAGFDEALAREIDLARRHDTPLSVLIADIDHFKKINDEYGHLYGDCVLREVAHRIQRCIRRSDMLFRYGGEEFVILLSNTTKAGANLTAERIRFAIARANRECEQGQEVTISLGGTNLREGDDAESLFARADNALYQAKNAGRNCVCFDAGNIKSNSG